MDLDRFQKICKEAIEVYGTTRQIKKFQEEIGEVLQANSKYDIDPTEEKLNHLCEEIADLKIMTAQMELMTDPEKVAYWFDFKMNRLESRIEAEKQKRAQNKNISLEEFLSNFKKTPKLSKTEINSIIDELIVIQNSI